MHLGQNLEFQCAAQMHILLKRRNCQPNCGSNNNQVHHFAKNSLAKLKLILRSTAIYHRCSNYLLQKHFSTDTAIIIYNYQRHWHEKKVSIFTSTFKKTLGHLKKHATHSGITTKSYPNEVINDGGDMTKKEVNYILKCCKVNTTGRPL